MMIQFGRPPTVDRYSLCTNEEISSSSQPASPSTQIRILGSFSVQGLSLTKFFLLFLHTLEW